MVKKFPDPKRIPLNFGPLNFISAYQTGFLNLYSLSPTLVGNVLAKQWLESATSYKILNCLKPLP